MHLNCPVCNKAGLPDFTKNIVICPQCNSDLKAFMLLTFISRSQKVQSVKYLIIGISALSIIFLGLFLKTNLDNKELISKNVFLNDSISKLQNINIKLITQMENKELSITEKRDVSIKYKVRKGDSAYKIAEFFYNDGSKYKQIENDNNLKSVYTLKVGQILNIKLSQE